MPPHPAPPLIGRLNSQMEHVTYITLKPRILHRIETLILPAHFASINHSFPSPFPIHSLPKRKLYNLHPSPRLISHLLPSGALVLLAGPNSAGGMLHRIFSPIHANDKSCLSQPEIYHSHTHTSFNIITCASLHAHLGSILPHSHSHSHSSVPLGIITQTPSHQPLHLLLGAGPEKWPIPQMQAIFQPNKCLHRCPITFIMLIPGVSLSLLRQ